MRYTIIKNIQLMYKILIHNIFTQWNTFLIINLLQPKLCIPGYTPKFLTILFFPNKYAEYLVLKSLINEKIYFINNKEFGLTESDKKSLKEYEKYLDILEYRINTIKNYRNYLNLYKNINI